MSTAWFFRPPTLPPGPDAAVISPNHHKRWNQCPMVLDAFRQSSGMGTGNGDPAIVIQQAVVTQCTHTARRLSVPVCPPKQAVAVRVGKFGRGKPTTGNGKRSLFSVPNERFVNMASFAVGHVGGPEPPAAPHFWCAGPPFGLPWVNARRGIRKGGGWGVWNVNLLGCGFQNSGNSGKKPDSLLHLSRPLIGRVGHGGCGRRPGQGQEQGQRHPSRAG